MPKAISGLVVLVAALIAATAADARPSTVQIDECRLYGYARGTADYRLCHMNVRRYWSTGPCGRADFAAVHREYCHVNPPPFL